MTSLPVANFRWKASLERYFATSGCACARLSTPLGDLRSHVAMYLYYYSSSNTNCTGCACVHDRWRHFRWKGPNRGNANLPVAHAHNILPVADRASSSHATFGHVTSDHVTSDHVTSGHVTSGCSPLFPHKYNFARTYILLMYLHLNNWEFCRVKSENMTLFMLSLIL